MHALKSLILTASLALATVMALPAGAEISFKAPQEAPPAEPEVPAEAPFAEPAPDPMLPPVPPVAPDPIKPISSIMIVNGAAISGYELDQRAAFLKALQQPGDLRSQALRALITDRLQLVQAQQMGLGLTPEQIQTGMIEFAARAKMSLPDFLKAMKQEGVAPETFRDFVRAGLLWRAATREKFAGRIEVTEAEVDRAIGMGAAAGAGRRVLLSELVIPANPGHDVAALAARVRLAIRSQQEFAIMARQFSKAATASGGGELGWLDEENLPPDVQGALAGLHAGEMTQVLPLQGGAALYFLRDEGATVGDGSSGAVVVDYAVLQGGQASVLAAQVTGCDGLYPEARRQGSLTRQTVAQAAVPGDLAATLAGMDAGEARALPDGRLVMLCARSRASDTPAARDAVRGDILNRKVSLLADGWIEELRFNAFIETP